MRTKIEPIERDVELIIAADLSPEAQSRALAEFSRAELRSAQDTNRSVLGRVPTHETFVDGRRAVALETVKPTGSIVFEFNLLEDLFEWIAEQLVLHSPRLTGEFGKSFVFLADGVEVPTGVPAPDASEYIFVNTQPYARKIERGLSDQAPEGVMEAVAALATRRFGNVARIRFTFRSLAGAYVGLGGRKGAKAASAAQRAANTASKESRQPAIAITV